MAMLNGTVPQPAEAVRDMLMQVATAQGWGIVPEQSGPWEFSLRKGVSATSWGSTMTVKLFALPAGTHVMIATVEQVQGLTDWGRGNRLIRKIFAGIGATEI